MEYWVAMNEKELQMSLLLLKKQVSLVFWNSVLTFPRKKTICVKW